MIAVPWPFVVGVGVFAVIGFWRIVTILADCPSPDSHTLQDDQYAARFNAACPWTDDDVARTVQEIRGL